VAGHSKHEIDGKSKLQEGKIFGGTKLLPRRIIFYINKVMAVDTKKTKYVGKAEF
jgi:hypothetical protein